MDTSRRWQPCTGGSDAQIAGCTGYLNQNSLPKAPAACCPRHRRRQDQNSSLAGRVLTPARLIPACAPACSSCRCPRPCGSTMCQISQASLDSATQRHGAKDAKCQHEASARRRQLLATRAGGHTGREWAHVRLHHTWGETHDAHSSAASSARITRMRTGSTGPRTGRHSSRWGFL